MGVLNCVQWPFQFFLEDSVKLNKIYQYSTHHQRQRARDGLLQALKGPVSYIMDIL